MEGQINGADYLAPAVAGKSVAIFEACHAPCGVFTPSALAQRRGSAMVHETTLDASMEEKICHNARGRSSTRQARRWRGKLPSVG